MNLAKNISVSLLGIVACLVVVYLANTGRFIGKFISRFLSCTDAPGTSVPCYGVYDIVVMVLASVVCLVLIVRIGIATYRVYGAT